MSALGQMQTLADVCVVSALPPKADIQKVGRDVCYVPKADIVQASGDLSGRRSRRSRVFLGMSQGGDQWPSC
jgi:hypothetical protein